MYEEELKLIQSNLSDIDTTLTVSTKYLFKFLEQFEKMNKNMVNTNETMKEICKELRYRNEDIQM